MIFRKTAWAALLAIASFCTACIGIDRQLGTDLIDRSQQFNICALEVPLEDVSMSFADSLSGYSSTRIVIGAIRDADYGLTTRSSAFTLVPALDTIDFGTNPEVLKFRLHIAADTVSVLKESDRYILQNVRVHELTAPLSFSKYGTNDIPAHSDSRITRGVPVFAGKDSLAFDFTKEFGQKYLEAIRSLEDASHAIDTSFSKYTAKLPGILLSIDPPAGEGGRINLLELSCLTAENGQYYRNSNEAILHVRSTYNGVRKDTAFVFLPGEPMFYDEANFVNNKQKFYQYAFNGTTHETRALAGKAGEKLFVEGGGGLKPVFSASEIRRKTLEAIAAEGGNPSEVIINKATLEIPFEDPEDYREYSFFPEVLSPTCCILNDGRATFAGLTDASSSTENQGDIDRSNSLFRPDITHHLQEMIRLKDESEIHNYDVWFLTVHEEVVVSASSSSYDSDYYRQLMYASYYNSLYGDYGYGGYGGYGYGGYGGYGYGGYGGYGYGYGSNYYSYMMLNALYSSANSNQVSKTQELDKDRFYKVILNGPAATGGRVPKLKVTFSIPK